MTTVAVRGLGATRRLLVVGTLLSAAAILVAGLLAEAPVDSFGWDFRYQYFSGAQAVADGRPLYVHPDNPVLDDALEGIWVYVYPPLLAVALVPLTPLSADQATIVALLGSVAALMGALALVGVRDVRCYAAALIWAPTIGALTVVNLTPLLVLALALAWRYRHRASRLALVLGLGISAKLLLAPMLVWAAVTRRTAVPLVLAVGFASTLGAWAVIGFQGLRDYPRLLGRLVDLHADNSYSFVGMAAELGAGEFAGRVVAFAVGAALLAACVRYGRCGDEIRSFTCAVASILALTPIVWLHYLMLLLIPLAIARPRFSPLWLLPVLLWVSPRPGYVEGFQVFIPAVAASILVAVLLARPGQLPARVLESA